MTSRGAGLSLPALLLVACASGPAGEAPGQLVLHVRSPIEVTEVRANGRRVARRIPPGDQVRVVRLAPGSYRWTRIDIDFGFLIYRFEPDDEPEMRFRVESGRASYPGQLWFEKVEQAGFDVGFTLRVVNRAAGMLEALREQRPDLVSGPGVVYGGPLRDDFLLEHHRAQRAAAVGPGSGAPGGAP